MLCFCSALKIDTFYLVFPLRGSMIGAFYGLILWPCHRMWLFHLYSTVKIQPFSPVFPLAESSAKAFCRLFLWNFKEKSINRFLWHSLSRKQASTIFYGTAFPIGRLPCRKGAKAAERRCFWLCRRKRLKVYCLKFQRDNRQKGSLWSPSAEKTDQNGMFTILWI